MWTMYYAYDNIMLVCNVPFTSDWMMDESKKKYVYYFINNNDGELFL